MHPQSPALFPSIHQLIQSKPQPNHTAKMQLFTLFATALFAAAVSASPVASGEVHPDVLAVISRDLEARQSYCTACKDGKKSCCSLTTCSIYSC
jgi:hypothetical protein